MGDDCVGIVVDLWWPYYLLIYIMGFSGVEAFRGTSAPSLKTEVSGEGGKFFAIHFVMWLMMFCYDLFT